MINRKQLPVLLMIGCFVLSGTGVAAKNYQVVSPNGKLQVDIKTTEGLSYSVSYGGRAILERSEIGLVLTDGELPGKDLSVRSANHRSATEHIDSPLYRQCSFSISYNEMDISFKKGIGVKFRAYDDGFAYALYTSFKNRTVVVDEVAEFNFPGDHKIWAAYSTAKSGNDMYQMAFQNVYTEQRISEMDAEKPVMTPFAVDLGDGVKILISDGGQESYPGMFLKPGQKTNSVTGLFARIPAEVERDVRRFQPKVRSRKDHIADIAPGTQLPWRIGIISEDDTQLPVNNIIYSLAPANRIGDTSWIKPGKIAWDWWNDWGLTGVDFKAGINTETYKYFIDFAAANGIEYVVLDEGWSPPAGGDVMVTIPEIDLPEILSYASDRNVGILLWAVMDVLDRKLEEACSTYAEMGIKGFKIDFLDRDDQPAIEQTYRVMEATAKHRLVVDLHGALKPFGINRTFPHVLNVEGVFGLEELKWSNPAMPLYDVTMPFIRMAAGNVDYTPGAMTNANKINFRDVYYTPMSQGTRAHQIAEYIVFDGPITTLCDSPSAYIREQECTDFIVSIPTVFDETRIPAGRMGEYIVTARRSGGNWYVGGLTNWESRELKLELWFLDEGEYMVEIIKDGINAASRGEDYILEKRLYKKGDSLCIEMAPGGGIALKLIKKSSE